MDFLVYLIFFGACAAAAATGAMFQPGAWYDALQKPRWTPPNWVFPVTWTILYFLIAYSATVSASQPGNSMAMAFWALQIALNTLWTPIFFGLRNLRAGMVVIVALWLSVFLAMWSAWQLDTSAGLALLPYLIWVSIASALNYSVWKLNPDVKPLDQS